MPADDQQEPGALFFNTPTTSALMLENGKAIAEGRTRPAIWPLMMAMETALRASVAYDEARSERMRFERSGEIPERFQHLPGALVDVTLEISEEWIGTEFRKLRDAALYPDSDCETRPPSTCPPDWDRVKWRQLKAGELVAKGDWVDMARDGWRDDPKWVPATNIGESVPDPAYPAHRVFRRVIEANVNTHP